MSSPLLAEVLRATGSVRAGNLGEATAILRRALSSRLGGAAAEPEPGAAPETAPETATAPSKPFRTADVSDAEVIPDPVPVDAAPAVPRDAAPDAAAPPADPPAQGIFSGLPGLGALPGLRLRKPLGEVLRTLSEGRKTLGLTGVLSGLAGADVEVPDGAAFLDLLHESAAGSRRYRLYVPASAASGPIEGLVVMLHGCKQNPEDFAVGTGMNAVAEANRLLVAYPGQTSQDNSMSCWNWFRPGDQLRDGGEPAILASLAAKLRDEYRVPRDRVFVAGLSAGGAMAAILAETWPDIFNAAGIHSGLPRGAANDVAGAFGAMRGDDIATAVPRPRHPPRLIVFHGTADRTVHPVNAERILSRAGAAGAPGTRHDGAPDGRGWTRSASNGGGGQVECWLVDGAPHAWSGGDARGSFTDPAGPDASAEMVRFFLGSSGAPRPYFGT